MSATATSLATARPHRVRQVQVALWLTLSMLLVSVSPLQEVLVQPASAAGGSQAWAANGTNDTGWVLLEATGADASIGVEATADLPLTFAPGALLSNLSLEVRVDGANGVSVYEPQLSMVEGGEVLFDWSGLDHLGTQEAFIGGDTHSGRLAPGSDSGARYRVPVGAEVTDLVLEALRPVDPAVTFSMSDFDITADAAHSVDGRLYLAVNDDLLMLDSRADPVVVDLVSGIRATAIAVDVANDRLLVATASGPVRVFNLSDGAEQTPLPAPAGDAPLTQLVVRQNETFGVAASGLWELTSTETSWLLKRQAGTTNWPSGTPTAVWDHLDVLHVGIRGGGVALWDVGTGTALSGWSTANQLPSDDVIQLVESGTNLLIVTEDAGIARRDIPTGTWLATWSSANWLASDDMGGVVNVPGWTLMLAGTTVHVYDTSIGAFTASHTLSSLDLAGDGTDLVLWPTGGERAPLAPIALVSDASGSVARLQITGSGTTALSNLLFTSGPSDDAMEAVVEVAGIVWIAAGEVIDRYDTTEGRWLIPLDLADQINDLATDGTNVFVATEAHGVLELNATGAVQRSWNQNSGLISSNTGIVSLDAGAVRLAIGHPNQGVSIVELANGTVERTLARGNGLPQGAVGAVVLRDDIVYVGIGSIGVARVNVTDGTSLPSWTSTGADNVWDIPVAADDETLYIGLYGWGVVRQNRTTGEFLDPFRQGGGLTGLSSNLVMSLERDDLDRIWIGTGNGMRVWDGSRTNVVRTSGGWWAPRVFYDLDWDGVGMYAATQAGICSFNPSTLQQVACMDSDDGLPSDLIRSIRIINGTAYVGTGEGAAAVDMANSTVVANWTAGAWTNNAELVIINDIAYLGLNGDGIARYDLTLGDWLSPWTEDTNVLPDDGISAMAPDPGTGNLWAAGAFGAILLDANGTLVANHTGGTNVSLPSNRAPAQILREGGVVYVLYNFVDTVERIDVANETSLSDLDTGTRLSSSWVYNYGMAMIGDVLHIGAASILASGGQGVVAWNTSTSSWAPTIDTLASIERVVTLQVGSETYIAYGEEGVRHLAANGSVLHTWDDNDLELPVSAMVEWKGDLLFATQDGIARYDHTNDTWKSTWTSGNGLPGGIRDEVWMLEVIGNDLWSGTAWSFGSQSNLIRLNGTTGAWTTWGAGQNGIPGGRMVDVAVCDGIAHFAMSSTWQGGVARYDLGVGQWLSSWAQGRNALVDNDVTSVTCDDQSVAYIGFNAANTGIQRYDYGTSSFLSVIDSTYGISDDAVTLSGLDWDNGLLVAAHGAGGGGSVGNGGGGGGVSMLAASGTSIGAGGIYGLGQGVTDPVAVNGGWLFGRPGGAASISKVERVTTGGTSDVDVLAGLTTGRITRMESNATHVWFMPSDTGSRGQGVLEGQLNGGTIEWVRGWSGTALGLTGGSLAVGLQDMVLQGDDLWITSGGGGMAVLELATGSSTLAPTTLHTQMDGVGLWSGQVVAGLMPTQATAAGVAILDPANMTWVDAKLISGLPSNFINDFVVVDDLLFISTEGGLARWNLSSGQWLDPVTLADGLPATTVDEMALIDGMLWLATPGGVVRYDPYNLSIVSIWTSANGLLGTASMTFASVGVGSATQWYIGHSGAGPNRPGATAIDHLTGGIDKLHPVDQLPSTSVTALAADAHGVHIATSVEPLIHWDAATAQLNEGATQAALLNWPVIGMDSDGSTLLALTRSSVERIDATGSRAWTGRMVIGSLTDVDIGPTGVWMVGGDGLHATGPAPGFVPFERVQLRRADPLMLSFLGDAVDVTNQTHIGQTIALLEGGNVTVSNDASTPGPAGMRLRVPPVTATSPTQGAAIWLAHQRLDYRGTWDLGADENVSASFQTGVDRGLLRNEGRIATLRLASPQNGSLWVRVAYDWERIDTPVEVVTLTDRPADGGGALVATWTPSPDVDFASYSVYAIEDSWATPPTTQDLLARSPEVTIESWSQATAVITTANGLPMARQGVGYSVVVVVGHTDGTNGEPSAPLGPVAPTDEVPLPPAWATAEGREDDDGRPGELLVEWGACFGLDIAATNLWVATSPITDAVALGEPTEVVPGDLNSTVLSLTPGDPVWIALTCVDESGQEMRELALIIGPVVPTTDPNDGVPPPRLTGVWADDVPDDEGGRIEVGWTPSTAEDCAWVTVYMLRDDGSGRPINAVGFEAVKVLTDCDLNQTVVSGYLNGGTLPLVDGQRYWVAVVASDVFGNSDLGNVEIVEATPYRNRLTGSEPPPRVEGLEAWDHAGDDGHAIDVRWNATDVGDFGQYVIWAGTMAMDDLYATWSASGDDPEQCGCLVVRDRTNPTDRSAPLQVTLRRALYDGNSPQNGSVGELRTNVPVHVTVTVHDVRDNVFLTRLPTTIATPIDNLADTTAPTRLGVVNLSDRPGDAGDALLLDFVASSASDLAEYEVYVDVTEFSSIGLRQPVMRLSRTAALPVVIDRLSNGDHLVPGMTVHVAVVPVDTRGNAHRDTLLTTSEVTVDNRDELPAVEGLRAFWDATGSSIQFAWDATSEPGVIGYHVYADTRDWTIVHDAAQVGELHEASTTNVSFTTLGGLPVSNRSSHWLAVVLVMEDGMQRQTVDPLELEPFSPEGGDGGANGGEDATGGDLFGSIGVQGALTGALAVSVLLAGMLLILVVRRRRRDGIPSAWMSPSGWDDGSSGQGWDDAPAPGLGGGDALVDVAEPLGTSDLAGISGADPMTGVAPVVAPPTSADAPLPPMGAATAGGLLDQASTLSLDPAPATAAARVAATPVTAPSGDLGAVVDDLFDPPAPATPANPAAPPAASNADAGLGGLVDDLF